MQNDNAKFKMVSFICNLPHTFVGLVMGLISLSLKLETHKNPFAIILRVKSLWGGIGYLKGLRATTMGNIILLSKEIKNNNLKHELIHVKQYEEEPFMHPFLYLIEIIKRGYKNNKYELEAYNMAKNDYIELKK